MICNLCEDNRCCEFWRKNNKLDADASACLAFGSKVRKKDREAVNNGCEF